MRCFYHQDKEAVGLCKSCGKGVCAECAVDLGHGLGCRGRCEDRARVIIQITDGNIQRIAQLGVARLNVVSPSPAPQSSPSPFSNAYVAGQLSNHIRQAQQTQRGSALFYIAVGVILFAAGIIQPSFFLDFAGLSFAVFGGISFYRLQRNRQPKQAETQTR